ncbi:MAG: segregation and condensation protein A [Planctomycetota bacterium]
MATFRVDLEAYNGPLDLLLFLIRREEVDVYDIPIARITEQYVLYVKLLEALDPNLAGDFLVMAATLMEIKSRTLLPTPPAEEEEEELIDPRMELVRQLLEYKTFKDAARSLGTAAQLQALRHARSPASAAEQSDELDIEEVEIWNLLEAFNRLLEQTGRRLVSHDVAYDDTPIALHATDVVDSLQRAGGSQGFEEIFEGRNKAELIGLFLALLELIRQRRIRAEQERPFGPITIHLLEAVKSESNLAELDGPAVATDANSTAPSVPPDGGDRSTSARQNEAVESAATRPSPEDTTESTHDAR